MDQVRAVIEVGTVAKDRAMAGAKVGVMGKAMTGAKAVVEV